MCCFFEPRHRFSLEALLAARSDTASSSRRRRSLAAPRIDHSVTVVDNRRIPLLHNSPEDAFLNRDGGDRRSDNGGGVDDAAGDDFLRIPRVSASRSVAVGPSSGRCAVSP